MYRVVQKLNSLNASWKVLDYSWIFQALKSPGNLTVRSWKVLDDNEDSG